MQRKYLILILLLNFTFNFSYSQQDCYDAVPVCDNSSINATVNGFGYDDFHGAESSGCLGLSSNSSTIETNSFWIKIQISVSGQFGFTIKPNGVNEDWDFAVYGPNVNCASLGEPIVCNYEKGIFSGYTGVGVDPNNGTQTLAYQPYMNVNQGEIYLIMINQFNGNNSGFEIIWEGGINNTNTNPLDCSTTVDLGPDRSLCEGTPATIQPIIFGENLSYSWSYLDESTGSYLSFNNPPSQNLLQVNTSGTFRVDVTNTVTNETDFDEIEISYFAVPNIVFDLPYSVCDEDGDGVEEIDLEILKDKIIKSETNLDVTFHLMEALADLNGNQIQIPFNRNVGSSITIWARVYNTLNDNCYDVIPVDIIVAPPINPVTPNPLNFCDPDDDGEYIVNLEGLTPGILNNQFGYVTYYRSEPQAVIGKDFIRDSDAFNTESRTIWYRAEVSRESSCYVVNSFEINVFTIPKVGTPDNILECDDDNDGIKSFDLKALFDLNIASGQDLDDFEILYYTSQVNLDRDDPIVQPYVTQTPYAVETIYAKISAINAPDCYATTSFTIQVLDSPNPTPAAEISTLSYCDDISDGDDANGMYNFDLTEKAADILNNQSPYVFDIEYYTDPSYSEISKIQDPTNFTNSISGGQTIYVRVINSNQNNEDCEAFTSFYVEVKSLPRAIQTYTLIQCDEDASPDGITNFKLSEADDFIRLGDETLEVTYHKERDQARAGTNSLNKNSFSNVIQDFVFARVTALNGCYRIVDVTLETSIPSFPPNYLRRFEVCDADDISDGKSIFNLTSATSEIISLFNSQNLRVSFYRNEEDALSEVNAIAEPSLYENEVEFYQVVWVRVESSVDGGCFGIGPVVELVVNRRPKFELIESTFVCLNNTPLNISVENPEGSYSYIWYDQIGNPISIMENAQIYEAGIYTVIATSIAGCDSFPLEVEVTASEIPNFLPEDISVIDNSEINSITIRNNGNLGIGAYEFSLDDIDGFYQDENVFYNVIPGRHTVYVRDKNGCGVAQQIVNVFGFPKFFTPNEDGVNDYWNVLGINPIDYPSVIVYIFDRHGKHLATIDGKSRGWNGIYNGEKSISADYWYVAELTDSGGNLSQYKGHFSLIRR